jgi:hypothetical protein
MKLPITAKRLIFPAYFIMAFIPVLTIKFILGGVDSVLGTRICHKFKRFVLLLSLKIDPDWDTQ